MMNNYTYITTSPYQTKKLADSLAKKIPKIIRKNGKAVILALIGELGGGKTTFVKGLAHALGVKSSIVSPTFIIERKYPLQNSKFKYFYHFDCYRLKDVKELSLLEFKKIISSPYNLVAIEWADKIKSVLPQDTIFLTFKFLGKNKRKINIVYG